MGIGSSKEPMTIAKEAIAKTRDFFVSIGMASHLRNFGIDDTHFDVMSEKAANGGLEHAFMPLTKEDVKKDLHDGSIREVLGWYAGQWHWAL